MTLLLQNARARMRCKQFKQDIRNGFLMAVGLLTGA